MHAALWALVPALSSLSADFDRTRLDDIEAWSTAARVLLDGPGRCIEVRGQVRLQVSVYTPGGLLTSGGRKDVVGLGAFEGRLEDGVWTSLETTWADAPPGADLVLEVGSFRPMLGAVPQRSAQTTTQAEEVSKKFDEEDILVNESDEDGSLSIVNDGDRWRIMIDGGGGEALGLLDEVVQELDAVGSATYVTYDDAHATVVLTEAVPLKSGGTLGLTTRFPRGEEPTSLDAVFPKRMVSPSDDLPWTLRDAQLHLRSQVTDLGVVPGVEGMSAVVRALGFTVGVDQRVAYEQVRACPGT